jgi:6-pyruvoyltetrahydropterin/6-carboxytetrahydropterin synthase
VKYTIGKRYEFDAAHVLHGLAAEHPCGRLHGHTYSVELAVSAESLEAVGFVVDYADLDLVMKPLVAMLDHHHLNDVLGGVNPTAEHLATWFVQRPRRGWRSRTSRSARPGGPSRG